MMSPESMNKFNVREVSRETKRVFKNLPCIVMYNKRPIAVIYDLQDGQAVQNLQSSASGGHRDHVDDDARGELQGFL